MVLDMGILELEGRRCFDFFWREANTDRNKRGYGLIRDRFPNGHMCASIASVGFGLSAFVIGVQRGWISYEEGYERVLGTLDTLWNNTEHVKGFFYHFIDIETGRRFRRSEVSNIDTAIAICGALTAGEYFGGQIKERAQQIYERVNWQWFVDDNRKQFYMGYSPERGFCGYWDFYAEQMMMYFLAAASPTFPVSPDLFYSFERHTASYGNCPSFINSWMGSIFTYQFTHAWFDFRNTLDREGIDWYSNSIAAIVTNRQYCIENSYKFKTFSESSWGLTACDGPYGYSGRYGAPPSGSRGHKTMDCEHRSDGTIAPYGAAASIAFTPQEAIEAMNHYYNKLSQLWGEYGFKDAYNLDTTPGWFGEDYIGIDKGITLLMIENFRTGLIWKVFMRNEYAQAGMKSCGVLKTDTAQVQEEAAASGEHTNSKK